MPRNVNFWQVDFLDVVLSEYADKSHNFRNLIFMTSHLTDSMEKYDPCTYHSVEVLATTNLHFFVPFLLETETGKEKRRIDYVETLYH